MNYGYKHIIYVYLFVFTYFRNYIYILYLHLISFHVVFILPTLGLMCVFSYQQNPTNSPIEFANSRSAWDNYVSFFSPLDNVRSMNWAEYHRSSSYHGNVSIHFYLNWLKGWFAVKEVDISGVSEVIFPQFRWWTYISNKFWYRYGWSVL